MDWHFYIAVALIPLVVYTQVRTRRVNVLALLLSPVVYAALAAYAAARATASGVGLLAPVGLLVAGGILGYAQGRATTVFYDAKVQNYLQRGGVYPVAFWAAALALRQGAARWLDAGLAPAAARLSTTLTIDSVFVGLLLGRAVALLSREPGLWAAGAAQWRDEKVVPPPGGMAASGPPPAE